MDSPHAWTGHQATTLRKALRMTVDEFARRLGVAPRTVANWAAAPGTEPRAAIQRGLDALLRDVPPAVRGPGLGLQSLRVAIAVVVRGPDVLLVRRRDEGAGIGWQFPAGIIKPGEVAEDVAVRETLAETGVHCSVVEGVGARVHPVTGVACDYLRCEYLAGDAANLDAVENAGVVWAARAELARFVPLGSVFPPVLRFLEGSYAAG